MDIEVTTTPARDDLALLSLGIQAYNQGFLPAEVALEADTHFAVLARDEQGQVCGGIRANAFWNYCIIELLWLSDTVRGQGVGTRLITAAEAFALANGFTAVRVETLDFQAKPFYEKQGYRVYGELANHPQGHTTYCLVKDLR
ncbi:GNAT family N-acetyltransferase [Shewanella sp.]|uniref:GNAT family N-acetyltransferase n=1 Tax=Shewanella sp. TaxID=50422 RepID=UPI003A974E57